METTEQRAPALLSPLTFKSGACARNRIALAPMTNLQSHKDGSLSDDELAWLTMRAEGGFGVVMTCASHVSLSGQGWEGELGIFDDRLLPGLTRLASAIRARGALAIAQIFHGGARSPSKLTGARPISASPPPEGEGDADPDAPRAATLEEIARVISDFASAAARAHRAGFDGVELHGAHGYLLCQFLSRAMNRRDDAYGGSFEARARLLREATRAVRAAVPASFIVGARISPEDYGTLKGLDLDESLTLAAWLCEDGIDYLHISLWDALANTKKRPEEHPIPLFRRACPEGVRLFVAGGVWSPAEAEALIEKGADVVALAKAAVANPDWPLRAGEPGYEPRRPPLTPDELRARGLGDPFITYMRRWKGFVSE
jgi:2,4-dienoyl-CoA reductase-like NADH-dependent reductase (Old Yellow Enzyme family)